MDTLFQDGAHTEKLHVTALKIRVDTGLKKHREHKRTLHKANLYCSVVWSWECKTDVLHCCPTISKVPIKFFAFYIWPSGIH